MFEIAAKIHNSHDHSFRDYSSTLLEEPEQKLRNSGSIAVIAVAQCITSYWILHYARIFFWVNFLWKCWTFLDISGPLDLQVAGRDGTPQKLDPHPSRSSRELHGGKGGKGHENAKILDMSPESPELLSVNHV